MTETAIIVLAAGMGTRMKSDVPKVLHKAAGRSLLGHVLSVGNFLDPQKVIVVHGPDQPGLAEEVALYCPQAELALQAERLGTAHAVAQALPMLDGFTGNIVVLYGDCPLILPRTLSKLLELIVEASPMAVLGFEALNPMGYGRLINNSEGRLSAIREELDCSPAEKAIRLCNSGVIAIDADLLRELLPEVNNSNAKGEFYLTDLAALAASRDASALILVCAEEEVIGVNDRVQLSMVENVLQNRLRTLAMANGATLIDPATVYFSADTRLGRDVVIEPNVWFGPNVDVGDGVNIYGFSHIEGARIAPGAKVGPFARLRPGSDVGENAKIGNFVEVKAAKLGEGAKLNHLSYIGDAEVGPGANVGAGTITCNYDGFDKHKTQIGAGAFIGSNSSLVAPVQIGDGAYVGSGSVITKDVPADSLALTRPEQVLREGWAERMRKAKSERKKK